MREKRIDVPCAGQGSLFILLFHMPIQYRVTDTLVLHMDSKWLVGVIGFVVAVALPLLFWGLCKRSRMLCCCVLADKKIEGGIIAPTAADSCGRAPALMIEKFGVIDVDVQRASR